jgi:hypothetical protein
MRADDVLGNICSGRGVGEALQRLSDRNVLSAPVLDRTAGQVYKAGALHSSTFQLVLSRFGQ